MHELWVGSRCASETCESMLKINTVWRFSSSIIVLPNFEGYFVRYEGWEGRVLSSVLIHKRFSTGFLTTCIFALVVVWENYLEESESNNDEEAVFNASGLMIPFNQVLLWCICKLVHILFVTCNIHLQNEHQILTLCEWWF